VPASASVLPKHTLVYHIFVKFFYNFVDQCAWDKPLNYLPNVHNSLQLKALLICFWRQAPCPDGDGINRADHTGLRSLKCDQQGAENGP
jgi:hypothetical protein